MPETHQQSARPSAEPGILRGLVVDWGGVLTGPLHGVVEAWAVSDGIDLEAYSTIMRDWLGEPYGVEARLNPIHALERGEMTLPDFEERLAAALSARTGQAQVAEGLLERMFAHFEHAPDMSALVRRARAGGLRTALLSNSWGISGEVGMRKPEPQIFTHTLDLLGLAAHESVFVDDFALNVTAAVEMGMVGVLHTSYEETLTELTVLFDRDMS